MLEKLLTDYADRFGKNFPIFTLRGTPEKEVIAILERCLRDGTPYEQEELDPMKALY